MADAIEQRDFFISFNSADQAYGDAINAALRAAGFTTFYYPQDVDPGDNIPKWMDNALMNSAQTLALYSPAYTNDKAVYSKAERYASWYDDPESKKRKLVPVVLNKTAMTPLIKMISYIDVAGKNPRDAAALVVARLKSPGEVEQRAILSTAPEGQVFNVLYRPNPNFSGRFEALDALQQSLRLGTNAATTAVAGMGGIGKTTLAAEYCHRFRWLYAGIWWIRAEQEQLMLTDLQALGQKLGVVANGDMEADARATLDYLSGLTEPWLLVYDNAPNADAVDNWLPTGAVRCLITSRSGAFDHLAKVTNLDQWSDQVTADYLLSRTERRDKDGASRLAHALGGLPLAAEQAAVFLKDRKGTSFDDYASDIATLTKRPRVKGAEGDYPETIYAAISKSLGPSDQFSRTTGAIADDLLKLCSFLGDDVQLATLNTDWAREILPSHLGSALEEKNSREDALAKLVSLSLLRITQDPTGTTLTFHPLVRGVVRDYMGPDARKFWSDIANRLTLRASQEGEPIDKSETEFIPDDAEIESDDLGRGVIAIALARRLHKIWCRLNIPNYQGSTRKEKDIVDSSSWTGNSNRKNSKKDLFEEDRDTNRAAFVMHLDAPWGGGKTTFANFLAQVLNPPGHKQGEPSFLRQRYGDVELGAIFIEDPASPTRRNWSEDAYRPWITIRFNARQTEHVSPPWWVFYQTIRKHCFSAILSEGRVPIRRNQSSKLLMDRISIWCSLWLHEIIWRLKNPKVMTLLITAATSALLFAILNGLNIIHLAGKVGAERVSFNLGDGIGLMLAGLTTLSALWGFGAIFTESIVPGSDTLSERLSLGSGDPFERFRKHFYRTIERVKRPVIVIVDDLDRCRPAVVVDLIRGIQTLLRSPRIVFAILGDRDWIERAFEAHHSTMSGIDIGPEQTFGARFVEKAFQMSFVLPAMSKDKQTNYVRYLLVGRRRLREDSTTISSEDAVNYGVLFKRLWAQGHLDRSAPAIF